MTANSPTRRNPLRRHRLADRPVRALLTVMVALLFVFESRDVGAQPATKSQPPADSALKAKGEPRQPEERAAPTLAIDPERAKAEYVADFKKASFDREHLKLTGGNAENLIRPEDAGLRVSIPSGLAKPRPVGVSTRFKVRGDFEIISSFEILKADQPKDGHGVGVMTSIETDTATKEATTLEWANHPKYGENYASTVITTPPQGSRQYRSIHEPALTRSGRLRITRVGPNVEVCYAEKDDQFVLLRKIPLGSEDLVRLDLCANTGWSSHPVDVRLKSLRVRAEELPGLMGRPSP